MDQKLKITLLTLLISFTCISVQGQDNWESEVNKKQLKSRFRNEVLTYDIKLNGDSMGYSILTYTIDGDVLGVKEEVEAMFGGNPMKETITSSFNMNGNEIVEGKFYLDYGGNVYDLSGQWKPEAIDVSFNGKDTLLTARPNLQRLFGIFALPKFVDDRAEVTTYNQFNFSDLGFRYVNLIPLENTSIETNWGEKEVYVLKAEGGVASQTFYLEKESHRIMRIDIPAMGWAYELVQIGGSE